MRYYHSRLFAKDKELFDYPIKKGINDSYARKCIAQKDNQPIVLTRDDLEDIDRRTKFKN